jgi:hypothetical protein
MTIHPFGLDLQHSHSLRYMPSTQLPKRQGKVALDRLYRGIVRADLRPLLFLDFDDTLCLGKPYGGFDVFQVNSSQPTDLWEKLWHPPSVLALRAILEELRPQIVLTTSWLRLLPREGFVSLFQRTGLGLAAECLHPMWAAAQDLHASRLQAITAWLHASYEGQHFVVLDDCISGTGLAKSRLQRAGRVVLCESGVGLHAGHLPAVRKALGAVTGHRQEALR